MVVIYNQMTIKDATSQEIPVKENTIKEASIKQETTKSQAIYQDRSVDMTGSEIGFPRLGMWWLDPYIVKSEDIAQYDFLMDEFERDGLAQKLAAARILNPKLKVFRPLSPSETSLFWDDEEHIPNPVIKNLPSDFFLLQVGTQLLEPINESDTVLHVKELYDPMGIPRFHIGGEVAIGEWESALVLDIDFDLNTITVKRGYVRSAIQHEAGEYIATHIRFWPGSWVMNVTIDCSKQIVEGMDQEVNWIDYYFNLVTGRFTGIFETLEDNDLWMNQAGLKYDGIIIDRFEDYESWLKWNENDEEIQIDLKHDGISASTKELDDSWRKGTDQLLGLLKNKFPSLPIIRNNPLTTRYELYNGQVYETGGWSQPTYEWWESLFVTTFMDDYYEVGAYMNWFGKGVEPLYVMIEVYEDEEGPDGDGDGTYKNPFLEGDFTPNYQRMRFSLTSTLLGNGYYSYEINTNGHGSLGLMWFDEYDNTGEGKGYLGLPLDAYKRLENGGYLREFENGLVLVNPQDQPISIQLDKNYQKIKGKQAPEINDGSVVGEVNLNSFDGLILLKTTHEK